MLIGNDFSAEAFINDKEGIYGLMCMTEGEAIECCEWMDSKGKYWCTGSSFKTQNRWNDSKGEGVYYTSDGFWGNRSYLKEDKQVVYVQYWINFKEAMIQDNECELLPSEELGSFLEDIQVI